jgi:hypothetical protein
MMFVELCEQQTFLFDRVLSTRWSHFLYHCPYESHSIPPPRISMLRKCRISYLSGILTMHEARRRGRPAAGAAHARVGVIKSVLMAHSIAGTLAFHAAPQHKLMVLRTSRTGGRSPAWGSPSQPKSAGLPGITRQRVGLPLKIFRLNSLLLLAHLVLRNLHPAPRRAAAEGAARAPGRAPRARHAPGTARPCATARSPRWHRASPLRPPSFPHSKPLPPPLPLRELANP